MCVCVQRLFLVPVCIYGPCIVSRTCPVIMLTSTQCKCLCGGVSSRMYVCPYLSAGACFASVYKTLAVGVCSCVYPESPQIVTELRKQFTVNRPFPCSNKRPMRLNSVPPAGPKHSPGTRLSLVSASARALPVIARSLRLVLPSWMCRKVFLRETGGNNYGLKCLTPVV